MQRKEENQSLAPHTSPVRGALFNPSSPPPRPGPPFCLTAPQLCTRAGHTIFCRSCSTQHIQHLRLPTSSMTVDRKISPLLLFSDAYIVYFHLIASHEETVRQKNNSRIRHQQMCKCELSARRSSTQQRIGINEDTKKQIALCQHCSSGHPNIWTTLLLLVWRVNRRRKKRPRG